MTDCCARIASLRPYPREWACCPFCGAGIGPRRDTLPEIWEWVDKAGWQFLETNGSFGAQIHPSFVPGESGINIQFDCHDVPEIRQLVKKIYHLVQTHYEAKNG